MRVRDISDPFSGRENGQRGLYARQPLEHFLGKHCNCPTTLGRLRDSSFGPELESLNAVSRVPAIKSHRRSTYLARGGCRRFISRFIEGIKRGLFVVVDVENGVQPGHLQQVLNFFGEVDEL
jgi:hypothetical protein